MSEKILKKRKLSENDYQIEVTTNERANNVHANDADIDEGEITTDSDCELIEEPPPPLIILDSTFASSSVETDEDDNGDIDSEIPNAFESVATEQFSIEPKSNHIEMTTEIESPADITDVNDVNDTTIEMDDFLFRIEFKNDKIFNEYKEIISMGIEQCLRSMNKSCEIIEESMANSMAVHENRQLPIDDNSTENNMFQIDTIPTPIKTIIKDVVPEYRRSSSTILFNDDLNTPEKAKNDARPMRRANVCFNCDGEHSIKDCTEPKNFAKIRANRQRFSSGKTAERYHIDVEQKFAKYQPGVISSELRNALGLERNELPLHILKMRVLGYPPGWFENAKVFSSGLQLIDSQEISEQLPTSESIDSANNILNEKYDLKKLIKYPGFNVKASSGSRDNHLYYRLPPMMPSHSLDAMKRLLKDSSANLPYKRKKMKLSHPNEENSLELTSAEMDIESDNDESSSSFSTNIESTNSSLNQIDTSNSNLHIPPPLPPSDPIDPPPLPPPVPPPEPSEPKLSTALLKEPSEPELSKEFMQTQNESLDTNLMDINESNRTKSPTLDDLDEEKRRILAALEDSSINNSIFSTAEEAEDSLINEVLELDNACQSQESQESEPDDESMSDGRISTNIPRTEPINIPIATTGNKCHVKEIVHGTPVLHSVSPFSSLPIGDAWSVGVSDVIDFENLPDSTGKYQQMKSVIGKIRKYVKEQQDDDNDD